MNKSLLNVIFFSSFVFAASFALADNERISANCPNDICTAIQDDLPDGAAGVNPNQNIGLGFGVYHRTTQQAPACQGTRRLYHVVRHYTDSVLYDNPARNNYAYLNSGEGHVFTYQFNSGRTGQLNRYQGVFYCWTRNMGTDRGTTDLLLGQLSCQGRRPDGTVFEVADCTAQTWSTPLFDQTTRTAPQLPVNRQPTVQNTTSTRTRIVSWNFSNPLRAENINDLIETIMTWLRIIVLPIAVIVIVISGIMMMYAGKDPGKFQTGKKMLIWAVIGLAVILIGEGFTKLIESIIELKNR